MIAKFAKIAAFACAAARLSRPVAIPCNDNRPGRRCAASVPIQRRPVLVRRWFITPSGALECRWSTAVAGGDDDDPVQSRPVDRRRHHGGVPRPKQLLF